VETAVGTERGHRATPSSRPRAKGVLAGNGGSRSDAISTAEGFYAALPDGGSRLELAALDVLSMDESSLAGVQEEAIAYLQSSGNVFRQLAA